MLLTSPALTALPRLLCVEHLEENGKPCLYLVFEFLSTDLKKWMDRNGKGPAHPLEPQIVKARNWGGTRVARSAAGDIRSRSACQWAQSAV